MFLSQEEAEEWIAVNHLAGTLTQYPVGIGVYQWAVANGSFKPKHEKHHAAEFIANFSGAGQQHFHYEGE